MSGFFIDVHVFSLLLLIICFKATLTTNSCKIRNIGILDPVGKRRSVLQQGFTIQFHAEGEMLQQVWHRTDAGLHQLPVLQHTEKSSFSLEVDKKFLDQMKYGRKRLKEQFVFLCKDGREVTLPFPKVVFCSEKDVRKCPGEEVCILQQHSHPQCQRWNSSSYDCHFENEAAQMQRYRSKCLRDGSTTKSECEEVSQRSRMKKVVGELKSKGYSCTELVKMWKLNDTDILGESDGVVSFMRRSLQKSTDRPKNVCKDNTFTLSCTEVNCPKDSNSASECDSKIQAMVTCSSTMNTTMKENTNSRITCDLTVNGQSAQFDYISFSMDGSTGPGSNHLARGFFLLLIVILILDIIGMSTYIIVGQKFSKLYPLAKQTEFMKMSSRLTYGAEKKANSDSFVQFKQAGQGEIVAPGFCKTPTIAGNIQIRRFYSLERNYGFPHPKEMQWDLQTIQEAEDAVPLAGRFSRFVTANSVPTPIEKSPQLKNLIFESGVVLSRSRPFQFAKLSPDMKLVQDWIIHASDEVTDTLTFSDISSQPLTVTNPFTASLTSSKTPWSLQGYEDDDDTEFQKSSASKYRRK